MRSHRGAIESAIDASFQCEFDRHAGLDLTAIIATMSTAPALRYEANASFIQVLETAGCSLVISIYTSSRVALVSAENGKLHIGLFPFWRPMGIASASGDEVRLAIATFQEIVVLADAPLLARGHPDNPGAYQHLLAPRATLFCGDIDAHDLVWIGSRLLAANTRFSCIAEIDGRYSFVPVWQPPFISELMPDDRCHLNGLAAADGRIQYATAFGQIDAPRGWSGERFHCGVLMEVPSGKIVLDNLCMPHSPRVFDGQLYVLDSGMGRVLRVSPAQQTAESIATLPGFTRGFDRIGDVLFVGLSRLRDRPGERPPIAANPDGLHCGVAAIDRRQGRVLGYLRFDDAFTEIFDIKVVPKFRRGGILSVENEFHRRALVLPGRAFWGEPIEDAQARRQLSRE
jgi:uncharacterized protein (TIGR03032 family)